VETEKEGLMDLHEEADSVVPEEVAATIFSQDQEMTIQIEAILAVIILEENQETIVEAEAIIKRTHQKGLIEMKNISNQSIGIRPLYKVLKYR
jgi:hypothetical protein